jgi:hypothetical protein
MVLVTTTVRDLIGETASNSTTGAAQLNAIDQSWRVCAPSDRPVAAMSS